MAGVAAKIALVLTMLVAGAQPDSITRQYGHFAVVEYPDGSCELQTEAHGDGWATVASVAAGQDGPNGGRIMAYVRDDAIEGETIIFEAGNTFVIVLHRLRERAYGSATRFEMSDMAESLKRSQRMLLTNGKAEVAFREDGMASAVDDLLACLHRRNP